MRDRSLGRFFWQIIRVAFQSSDAIFRTPFILCGGRVLHEKGGIKEKNPLTSGKKGSIIGLPHEKSGVL
jgi:hypothetical protein